MKNPHVYLFSYCFKDILNILRLLYPFTIPLMRITSYRNVFPFRGLIDSIGFSVTPFTPSIFHFINLLSLKLEIIKFRAKFVYD